MCAAVAMLVLAALDLVGAFAAKEAVVRRSPRWAALGAVCFVLLFWIYASSLRYVDLTLVTLGWIVLLQLGVLALDSRRYRLRMPPGKWIAVAVILAAQAYLILAPTDPAAALPG